MVDLIHVNLAENTSPTSFVRDEFEAYIRAHIESFIRNNKERPEVQHILTCLSAQMESGLSLEAAANLFKQWMKEGNDDELLLAIQVLICQEAFESGDLKAHTLAEA